MEFEVKQGTRLRAPESSVRRDNARPAMAAHGDPALVRLSGSAVANMVAQARGVEVTRKMCLDGSTRRMQAE